MLVKYQDCSKRSKSKAIVVPVVIGTDNIPTQVILCQTITVKKKNKAM